MLMVKILPTNLTQVVEDYNLNLGKYKLLSSLLKTLPLYKYLALKKLILVNTKIMANLDIIKAWFAFFLFSTPLRKYLPAICWCCNGKCQTKKTGLTRAVLALPGQTHHKRTLYHTDSHILHIVFYVPKFRLLPDNSSRYTLLYSNTHLLLIRFLSVYLLPYLESKHHTNDF